MNKQMNNDANTAILNAITKNNMNNKNKVETPAKNNTCLLRYLLIGFVIIAAFAWHDVAKFYISRSVRLSPGTQHYYVYYALIITLVTLVVLRYTNSL